MEQDKPLTCKDCNCDLSPDRQSSGLNLCMACEDYRDMLEALAVSDLE